MRYALRFSFVLGMALMLSGLLYTAAEAGGRVYVGGSVRFGHYYGPYYDPWYDPWYPPGGYYYVPPDHGWLWTQVEPNAAEVWVDGKFFGRVKAFDGPINHLRLPIGEHEAQFRHPDYVTYRTRFFIYPGETTSINFDLLPVSRQPGGETVEPDGAEAQTGKLLVEVQPGGAEIYVDGRYEATSTAEGDEIVISARAGIRQLRASKQGYIDYLTEAEVRPGGRTRVSIRLKERQVE